MCFGSPGRKRFVRIVARQSSEGAEGPLGLMLYRREKKGPRDRILCVRSLSRAQVSKSGHEAFPADIGARRQRQRWKRSWKRNIRKCVLSSACGNRQEGGDTWCQPRQPGARRHTLAPRKTMKGSGLGLDPGDKLLWLESWPYLLTRCFLTSLGLSFLIWKTRMIT